MPAHTRPRPTQPKFRLLYLGNDLELIATLRKSLTELDYLLVSSSNRETAILFLKSEIPYDLLLIDLEWREQEALKMARLVHSLRNRKQMPIILVATTGWSGQLEKLARRAGVSQCVEKTPNMDAVLEAIRHETKT